MDFKELNDAMEQKLGSVQADLNVLQADGTASKAQTQKLIDEITKQSELITEITEGQKNAFGKSFNAQADKFILDNHEKMKDMYTKGQGMISFEPDVEQMKQYAEKAVGDIFRANGTLQTAVPAYNDVSMQNVDFRNDNWIASMCTTTNTSSASYPYTEVVDGEGAIAYTAEGGEKPQLDLDWSVAYATPYKPAGYEVLSEEVVDDVPRIQQVATDHVRQKHDLAKMNAIMFGDGVGNNPTGATVLAGTFVGTGMTGALPIGTANIMDVINACITEIYTTHNFVDEMPKKVNLVMVNPIDFFLQFVAMKDGNGLPLYPTASLFDRVVIGGVTIVPWEKIPAGKIFVGDMRKYNLTNYKGYSLRVGWINDQLITNKFTIVGESRHHAFVKSLDELAFIYDDISAIVTIIEAVA